MPGFKYDLKRDLSLANEVMASRPAKLADWDSIAVKLSLLFSTNEQPVLLKGRGCRDRLELILKKYQEEDKKALKR